MWIKLRRPWSPQAAAKLHLVKFTAVFAPLALSVPALCGIDCWIINDSEDAVGPSIKPTHQVIPNAAARTDTCQRCRQSLLMRGPVVWEETPARVRRELALRALGDM